MRREKPFPLKGYTVLIDFLKNAWTNGWLDEYSNDHFLIRAIENRLGTFVGKELLINNDINQFGLIKKNGDIKIDDFSLNFCINFSGRMQLLANRFGEENIKNFITNQMSAGKQHYKENAFFEALSEVSILSFYSGRYEWSHAIYEPSLITGVNNRNPEARYIGSINCRADCKNLEKTVTISIEVKSPEFPHNYHENEKIVIPTVLLTDSGRKEVKSFCKEHNIVYMDPRVLKLRDFINSAASKFTIPKTDEFNLLYINWSYRDFPSNSFLEAWSLLTNELNGILTHPEFAESIGIIPDALQKITAVIVYTESLEGLMFSNFTHVWQRNGAGTKFRMWVIDEKLRNAEWRNETNILFYITGMNPSEALTQMVMIDGKSKTTVEMIETDILSFELARLIKKNAKR
ncbi:MAG: hypothetical protein KZY87_20605 [Lachnospiraceae bacterium]|nr:hypothetical protein [Lachnospiraceae bacterium]